MEPLLTIFFIGATAVIITFLLFWIISLLIKNPSIIDVCWGIGFIVLALVFIINGAGWNPRNQIMFAVVSFWGLRIAWFVLKRLDFGKKEDHRYVNIRESWKPYVRFNFLVFFIIQAMLEVFIALPLLFIAVNTSASLTIFDLLGAGLCLAATIGESIADQQLEEFKKNPDNKGKVCEVGLWNYSRHPNYFFEFMIWAALFIFAIGSPYGLISIVSPLIILHLVLNVSGIPFAEKLSVKRRGDAYRVYQQTTSSFIPLPKKENMKTIAKMTEGLMEKNLLPDYLIRFGIRGLLKEKLRVERMKEKELGKDRISTFVDELKLSPIAVNTSEANDQHYEVPTEFFKLVMGKYMKYSCGYWKEGVVDFDQSERDMLEITIERADLKNGQDVLELGCGWGSLSLYMAEKFPASTFTGVSNSSTQKKYIDSEAQKRGLKNLTIITKDMNEFSIEEVFDRVVSIEMFEHMRNYQELLEKTASCLKDDGKLFVHIFTHKDFAYLYELNGGGFDWMARYFFTGGIMPSDDLLLQFDDHFKIQEHWRVSGTHYQKTSNGWLLNMDRNKEKIMPILKDTYGEDYRKWWVYWRVFFMSCAELWGYKNGSEWIVSHYLFNKRELS